MDAGMDVSAKAKQSRSLAFPTLDDEPCKQAKTNTPVGTSKQAVSKRKALEKMKNGTWVQDTKKWERYLSKLGEIDCHFEVLEDPRFARSVKHTRCGSWLLMSAPYEVGCFKSHYKSCSYSMESGGMKTLANYGILVHPMNAQSPPPPIPSMSSSSCTNLPCLGITEKDDPRIAQYFKRTPSNSAGGINFYDIAIELFNDDFKNLSRKKKDIVRQKQFQTHTWSNDHIRKCIHAIGKKPCDGKACLAKDGSLMPCNQCLDLLNLRAFQNAISRKCCKNENRGFTPHVFQSPDVGKIYSLGLYGLLDGVRTTCIPTWQSTQLNISFQTCNHGKTLTRFVRQVVAGHFNDKQVFMDLVHVLVVDAERLEKGHGLQNMNYPPAFDDWCHKLLCIRPEAYRSFRVQFAGRTEHSFLSKRSASLGFRQGISQDVLERALKYLNDYNYPQTAPLALSVDDTKLLPAFRPYFDGSTKKWYIVGNTGEPLEVSDLGALECQLEDARALLATKLRLWVLQIPLPYVPPLVLVVVPLASSTNVAMLADFEQQLLHILLGSDRPLCIVSLGSDGSVLEHDAC